MDVLRQVPLSALPRLAQALAEPDGALSVDLKLRYAADGSIRLWGRLASRLMLRCGRCLEATDVHLEHQLDLRLVTDADEERRRLATDDPYLAAAGVLDLRELVENEALLALPTVVHCQRPECLRRWADGPKARAAPRGAATGRGDSEPPAEDGATRADCGRSAGSG